MMEQSREREKRERGARTEGKTVWVCGVYYCGVWVNRTVNSGKSGAWAMRVWAGATAYGFKFKLPKSKRWNLLSPFPPFAHFLIT